MNKVFKVVFNAVRNKMMVVNEMTSSMQVGRKKARVAMVVGAALLMLGEGASAEKITTIPGADSSIWKENDSYTYIYDFVGNRTGSDNVFSFLPTETVSSKYFNAGYSSSKDVINNSITISGGTFTNSQIYGGFGSENVNVGLDSKNKNQVLITGGNFDDVVAYGGYTPGSGSAQFNTVRIGNDNATTNPEGNFYLVVGGRSGGGSATNNSVEILAPNIEVMGTSVIGGDSLKLSENNEVTINGGQFILQKGVFGGWSEEGNASNNVVTITGGVIHVAMSGIVGGFSFSSSAIGNVVTITGGTSIVGTFEGISLPTNIVGGLIDNDSGSAKGNTVNIGGAANLTGAILFGGATYNYSSQSIEEPYSPIYGGPQTPNTLNIGWDGENKTPWSGANTGKVKSIQGFDVINFHGVTWKDGAILVEAEYLELDNTKITVTVKDGTITADSESMTLIKTTEEIEGNLAPSGNTVTLNDGIANIYSGKIEKDSSGQAITVTLSKNTSMNEQILVLGESRAAATAFTNQATDLIDSTLDDLGQKATLGVAGFAAVHGNASEYETGSHVDVNGWSMIVGASSKLENGTTVGAFFETGTGNYRTFNDLDGVTMRGDGESTYWGGGLMARHGFDNGFYAEGSVRVGKLENELKNAVKGSQGLTGYDIDTLYFGAHIGAGKVFELNSAGDNIDVYTKFLYTYNEGKSFAIDGDSVNYSSVTSERLRLGARYTKNVSDKLQAKVGAAWEYDFNGDSKNTVANYDLGTPSLGGSTFMADVGVRYQAAKNVSVDFSGRGYTGQRDGVSGQVNVKFSF